jgi:Bacteriophage holin family
MGLSQVVHAFVSDTTFKAVAVLVLLDLVLGIVAAVKLGQFAFSKVSAFLKDDLLGKVLPWFSIYAAWKWAPSVDVLGVGLKEIQEVVFAGVVVALVASLTSSLADLGLTLPKTLATGENEGATPKPSG